MLAGSITLNGTDRGRLEPLEDLAHLSHDHVRRVVTVRFSNLKSFNLEFRSCLDLSSYLDPQSM